MAKGDYFLTAEELRLRKRKRLRLALVLLLILALLLGAIFGAKPAGRVIKGWQARRHAQKAFALIEKEDWNEARKAATDAYQLRAVEPQAIRAVARLLSRTRQQQALEFWDQLEKYEPLTRDDRRDEVIVALAAGELQRATVALGYLLNDNGREASAHDWILAAQVQSQQADLEKALESLGKAAAHPAATTREQFQSSLLQLQAARTGKGEIDQTNQTAAWQRLGQLATRDDAVGLDTLALLAQHRLASSTEPSIPDISREDLIRRLDTHPLAKAPQKLIAIDLQLQADPTAKEALIARAIEQWKDAEPPQLAVLATWLNGKGEFLRHLDTIPLEHALQSHALLLQRMDALAALGRWEEIRQVLNSERFPLDPVIQQMYLARCNARLENAAAARNNWQRALEAASADAGKLMMLADYAEKNGILDIADTAYKRVVEMAPNSRPPYLGRLRVAQAQRNTARIHALLEEMLSLWANDISIQNDEAFTRALLLPADAANLELPKLEARAETLMRNHPRNLAHRTLLALVRLKLGRPSDALTVYQDVAASADAVSASARVVYAVVLAQNDRLEEARELISGVTPDQLLPEENELANTVRQ